MTPTFWIHDTGDVVKKPPMEWFLGGGAGQPNAAPAIIYVMPKSQGESKVSTAITELQTCMEQRFDALEQRLDAIEDQSDVVELRELSGDQLRDEIKDLMSDGQTRYEDEIADELRVDVLEVLGVLCDMKEAGEVE